MDHIYNTVTWSTQEMYIYYVFMSKLIFYLHSKIPRIRYQFGRLSTWIILFIIYLHGYFIRFSFHFNLFRNTRSIIIFDGSLQVLNGTASTFVDNERISRWVITTWNMDRTVSIPSYRKIHQYQQFCFLSRRYFNYYNYFTNSDEILHAYKSIH